MKQRIWIILLAVLVALLMAAAVFLWIGVSRGGYRPAPQKETKAAPDFTAYTPEGVPVKLSDFKGKPVVLNFWASWCGPCKSEMPVFQAAYDARGEEIQFLMVNLTGGAETIETAAAFLVEAGYTFPVFYDTAQAGSTAYQVYSIPASYFIDKNGNIVASHVGAMDEATLQGYLDKIS